MDHNEWLANEQHLLKKDMIIKKYSDAYVNRKMFVFLSLLFFFMPLSSFTLESRGQTNEFAWFCEWCHNKNKPGDQWCNYCQRRKAFFSNEPNAMKIECLKYTKEENKVIYDLVNSFLEMSEEDRQHTYDIYREEIFGVELAYHIASEILILKDTKSRSFFEVLEDEEEEEIQIRR